ncbi:FAD binding domain-containing protein [Cyathus striatus]|nr:FAD binding domain-containing protein [Cyathus striatus]
MSDSALLSQLRGDIVTSDHPDYSKAIARWAKNAERLAKVVVYVKDEHDISLVLRYAKDAGLPLAIHGGGHNPAGASSVEGGVVIDLSRYMNKVRVDAEKRLGYVGGGALWATVDKEAMKHGLATVGGTVNHTGVGGLILGGGYGWLSPAYGLAIDNLVDATVVIADGSVIHANEKENPDLFFGIRGGGCNFGVAAEFVLKLYPQRTTVYAGFAVFLPHLLEQIVVATKNWWPTAGEKEGMIQMTTVGPDRKPAVVIFFFYNGSETEGRKNFKSFLDIGPISDFTKEMSYDVVNSLQNPMAGHGSGVYMKGLAHNNPNPESIIKAHERVIEIFEAGTLRPNVLYEYFSLSKINSVRIDATAFQRVPTANVLVAIAWDGSIPDQSDVAREYAYELADIISSGQIGLKVTDGVGYSNYDPDSVNSSSNKAKLIFGANYSRLQGIKAKYDPDNIFNKWFAITPATATATK